MKQSLLKIGAWSSIFITVLTLWAGLYPFKTIDVKQPAEVLNSLVDAGKYVEYEIDYCKYTNAHAKVTQSLIRVGEPDELKENYTNISFDSNLPKRCGKFITTMEVPEYIPEGEYYVSINATYYINFLQQKSHNFRTESFYVLNPKTLAPFQE
jgi:hypothetical protein